MFAPASELYDRPPNIYIYIYTAWYDKLTKAQKKRVKVQNRPENLALDLYLNEDEDDTTTRRWRSKIRVRRNYCWDSENKSLKKKGTGLKILTPNKLLTRPPILLAQIKVVNNSHKLKN